MRRVGISLLCYSSNASFKIWGISSSSGQEFRRALFDHIDGMDGESWGACPLEASGFELIEGIYDAIVAE